MGEGNKKQIIQPDDNNFLFSFFNCLPYSLVDPAPCTLSRLRQQHHLPTAVSIPTKQSHERIMRSWCFVQDQG